MTAEALDGSNTLASAYAGKLATPNRSLPWGTPRGADEFIRDGAVRAGSDPIAEALTRYGTIGLQTRRRTVERLVADDGITYGGSHGDQSARPWLLDPLPLVLGADEWARLERGLDQRARLLDALFTDLIGPRRVLTERLLPGELIAGHAGFLPPAHGIVLPGARKLPMVATDLARTPGGDWMVVSDRTQAPSGAGYAMANRRIISRAMESIHRRTHLRRLRGWFDLFQAALQDAAPPDVEDLPRVVLLSPGPGSETAFDQGLLATLLGHPVVESDDLVMRDGRLWLRTMGRLETVDVVLRRVDANWTDSLDLLAESRLGVPGLVASARRGAVSIVNPLRAAVLENPGLLPFQDALARVLIGEDLLLDVPHTWWCGDPAQRDHVLSRLGGLVLKPINRGRTDGQILGWLASEAALDDLRRRITAEPWAWTAQEPLAKSTAPVVTPLGLEPRNVVLRTFGVAVGGQYHFLPGGLARVGTSSDAFSVTNVSGAASKDVWVLDTEEAASARIDVATTARARVLAGDAPLPSLTPRTASNLYWMGRYAERAELGARLLMVVDNLVEDHLRRPETAGHAAMRALLEAVTEVTMVRPGFTGPGSDAHLADPIPRLEALLVDPALPGSVAHNAARATASALASRELLSLDTPSVLSRLGRVLAEVRREETVPVQLTSARVLDSLLALAGLSAESLVRDDTWAFLDSGRRMERAQNILRLLRHTIALVRSPVAEAQVVESVLRVGDSLITYRRRMAAGVGSSNPTIAALSLLLSDEANPRSLAFQLDALRDALALTPDPRVTARLASLRHRLHALDIAALSAGLRVELAHELAALEALLRDLSDEIEAAHFTHQAPQSSFAVAELRREVG